MDIKKIPCQSVTSDKGSFTTLWMLGDFFSFLAAEEHQENAREHHEAARQHAAVDLRHLGDRHRRRTAKEVLVINVGFEKTGRRTGVGRARHDERLVGVGVVKNPEAPVETRHSADAGRAQGKVHRAIVRRKVARRLVENYACRRGAHGAPKAENVNGARGLVLRRVGGEVKIDGSLSSRIRASAAELVIGGRRERVGRSQRLWRGGKREQQRCRRHGFEFEVHRRGLLASLCM